MHKRKLELTKMAEAEGITDVEVIVTRGTHYRIEGSYLGRGVKVLTAFSPSDWRGDLNTRARIRHQLKAIKATHG